MGGFAGVGHAGRRAGAVPARARPIRAVVLRVNSPGGSAFASDVVARDRSRRARRRQADSVVSMGDLAASGGYYIAAPADVIYAEPSTLTGSIGVFGYKVDAQKLVESLGVNVETYRRGAHADILSAVSPLDRGRAVGLSRTRSTTFTACSCRRSPTDAKSRG